VTRIQAPSPSGLRHLYASVGPVFCSEIMFDSHAHEPSALSLIPGEIHEKRTIRPVPTRGNSPRHREKAQPRIA